MRPDERGDTRAGNRSLAPERAGSLSSSLLSVSEPRSWLSIRLGSSTHYVLTTMSDCGGQSYIIEIVEANSKSGRNKKNEIEQ